MGYKKLNMNPKNLRVGDCVIRALTLADDDEDYKRVYTELFEIALKRCRMPNDKVVYSKWLENHGWVMMKMPKKPDGKRYTLQEFADDNPEMTFIAGVAGHLTYVEKSTIIDIWYCGNKCIGNYWIKI